jgi:hypothetical protein
MKELYFPGLQEHEGTILSGAARAWGGSGGFTPGYGGVRGERLKKLEEFFYPLSLKDEVFKTER